MNKIKNLLLVFAMIFLLSGCTKNTVEEKKEIVNDEAIITKLRNQIISLESLDKTIELYTKGSGKSTDYTNEDMLRYGLNVRMSSATIPALTQAEIQLLASKNILNVSGAIEASYVGDEISKNFSMSSVKYTSLTGCPSFYYDEDNSRFYIQSKCVSQSKNSIYSYIDKVEKKDNTYYVTIYAGLSDGSSVYNDFNKSKVVVDLLSKADYTITDNDKKDYTLYTYEFEKNGNGNYIFKSFNK